jgi:hypothetical protein
VGNDYTHGLEDMGIGTLVNDTVGFGGKNNQTATIVNNFEFGVIDEYIGRITIESPVLGIVGLGAMRYSGNACTDYPSWIQQLYDQDILKTRAFSVHLGPDDLVNVTVNLLLGGVDQAK